MIRDILGTQSVNVSFAGGGPVLFVCALAAILACASAWDAKSETRALREKMDVMQAHLSVIYMQAPHLKPKDSEQ
jgi:uncharacterized protein involved in high-affinity Fe2+ transport